ncbi:O-antigen/teichoic acid export membrane protein [Fontibacillus solani]|uniref:O-antigen/teichoic acid export membrane protein n=1 Tax=Fontibacillus solani TaxID=1572857 RepID=A0A7W3SWM5_9BACL|nr:oligosaccharide flippase family protein [Fontibacillus solani]MBA9087562.1 O-antigen/teichoic acid export membrane protein [Fontibacillus solani]
MKSSNDGVSSGLLKGAAVLSVAAIITKLLGTLQKIPLQNIGGDGVFGIYNTVYPFYTILITLATAGFPTVVSKFVAEQHVLGGEAEKREVLRVATGVMALLGIVGSMTMYFGAPFISRLIGSSHLVPALRSAAPALLFIPLSASLRGYFQGLQDMMPTAVSQVIEQAVRVTVMIVLLLYLSGIDAPESLVAGGALAGSAAGGAAGLIVVLLYWRKYNKKTSKREYRAVANQTGNHTKGLSLLREMLYYAIPVCLAALAVPLISLVDTFTLPRLLTESSDELGTMIEVGVYNRGIPLVQLVTMLASSLSVLFIPVLAEMNLRGDREGIRKQSGLALKWFWLIGLASSTGLAILAEPINIMLYEDGTGTNTMIWIAWTAAPSALVAVTAALLQGLGVVRAPALNLLAAAAIKTALNVLLVPQLGITGAAIAGIAAYTAAAALNLALLLRQVQLRPRLVDAVLRPVAAVLAMSAAVLLLRLGADAVLPHGRLLAALESLLGVLLGAAVFAAAVLRTRLLSAAELAALPRIGPKLLKALRRMHLLR